MCYYICLVCCAWKEVLRLLTTIDLFAGAGGLSYGFERTGKIRIVAAAEKNPNARKTYRKNHPAVRYFYEDVQDIDYDEIKSAFGNIDLVIGGPPCQGFSNANRQHTTMISMNNRLVKEFVRCICELRPKAFLMENVAMLRSQVHRFIVDELDFADPELPSFNLRDDKLELLPADAQFEGALEIAQHMDTCQIQKWTDRRVTVFTVLYRYRMPSSFLSASRLLPQVDSRGSRQMFRHANVLSTLTSVSISSGELYNAIVGLTEPSYPKRLSTG